MSAIRKAVMKEELSRHCRRRTRRAELTLQLIEELLLRLSTATDSLGVPKDGRHLGGEEAHQMHSGSSRSTSVHYHRVHQEGWDGIASV